MENWQQNSMAIENMHQNKWKTNWWNQGSKFATELLEIDGIEWRFHQEIKENEVKWTKKK